MSDSSRMRYLGNTPLLFNTDGFEIAHPLRDADKSKTILTKEEREEQLKNQITGANERVTNRINKWNEALDNVETTVDELLERNNTILKCK